MLALRLGILGLLLTAFMLALVLTIIFVPRWESIKQALTPQPEKFTELYFEDHLALPKSLSPGLPFKVAFTVHNVESASIEYPVEITIQDEFEATKSATLYTTTLTLDHDQTQTTPVELEVPTQFPTRSKITVKLLNLNQSIHFWVNQSATPSASPATTTNQQTQPILSP